MCLAGGRLRDLPICTLVYWLPTQMPCASHADKGGGAGRLLYTVTYRTYNNTPVLLCIIPKLHCIRDCDCVCFYYSS